MVCARDGGSATRGEGGLDLDANAWVRRAVPSLRWGSAVGSKWHRAAQEQEGDRAFHTTPS